MDKIDQIICEKFKKAYPTVYPILKDLMDGVKVADIATKHGVKESSVRNLKTRYREFF